MRRVGRGAFSSVEVLLMVSIMFMVSAIGTFLYREGMPITVKKRTPRALRAYQASIRPEARRIARRNAALRMAARRAAYDGKPAS